jgi:hypothetical protein
MRYVRAATGPLRERPFYKHQDIERICVDALAAVNLLPQQPGPIRIERFVEQHFRIHPHYDDLAQGVLGYTEFGPNGVVAIHVAKSLSEHGDRADRVLSSTLAHEAGHGLLQGFLFGLEPNLPLFEHDTDVTGTKILCRTRGGKGYDGRWWEVQANLAIGALLLPINLLATAIDPFLMPTGSLGLPRLPEAHRPAAINRLAEVFHVTEAVASIRIADHYPSDPGQLTL